MSVQGHIVDVVARRIYNGEIILEGNQIKEINPVGDLPAEAPYILPGFIDSHVHIESSMLLPENFAPVAVRSGVVAAIADPHEIANVLGKKGVEFMIDNGKKVRFGFHFGASPCVPAVSFEPSGAELTVEDVEALLQRDDVYGLAEVMNVPGVVAGQPDLMAKMEAARHLHKPIDGHSPGATGETLLQYIAQGVSCDHECSTIQEALERITLGVKIQIREGSAARNFEALCPIIEDYPDYTMFCTDDKEPDELAEGYIDGLVRRSVAKGFNLWNVLQTACVNPRKHFLLPSAYLQVGDVADFILVNNLRDFAVQATYIEGVEVFNSAYDCGEHIRKVPRTTEVFPNNFSAAPITQADLEVPAQDTIKVIEAYDGELLTGAKEMKARIEADKVVSDTARDILKIVVYDRYRPAKPQIGFIHGFGLQRGALASSIAHDNHNIVAVGTSDEELVKVINQMVTLKGGIVLSTGENLEQLPLPIAGLMSGETCEHIAGKLVRLKGLAQDCGCVFKAPFMTMAFMSLAVIPALKLTSKGLFDVQKFDFTHI